jgi:hypothetical protein
VGEVVHSVDRRAPHADPPYNFFGFMDKGFDDQNDILFFNLIDISNRSANKKSPFVDMGESVP